MLNYIFNKVKHYPLSCLLIFAIWIACMFPVPETPLDDVEMIDKWTHFVMYGSLTLCIWLEYFLRHRSSRNTPITAQAPEESISATTQAPRGQHYAKLHLFIGGFVCPIIMGGCIELAQESLTTCRSGDWLDFLSNSLGVCLGTILGLIIFSILKCYASLH